ncbi:MAG: AtpZ/AtpI family protein [Rickettsiaceae bacterium]
MVDRKIQELKNKIDKIKNEQINPSKNSSLVLINVASELVAGVIVGVMIGLLFDNVFNTKPWFLVICIIFAMISAFRSIWKKYINN